MDFEKGGWIVGRYIIGLAKIISCIVLSEFASPQCDPAMSSYKRRNSGLKIHDNGA